MNKKELIGCVEEIAANTTLKNILSEREGGRQNLGKSQFRAMAEMCDRADFYEEVKLMLEYKTAKGNGWDVIIATGGKKCGDVFIEYIEKIKTGSGDNEQAVLRNLALFFGYMYWKATVLLYEKNSKDRKSG